MDDKPTTDNSTPPPETAKAADALAIWEALSEGEREALLNSSKNGGLFKQVLVDKGLIRVLQDGRVWKECEFTDLGHAVLSAGETAQPGSVTVEWPVWRFLEYIADQAEDGKWGVIDKHGGILYEYDFENETEADFIASYHCGHPNAEYERDVLPAWEAWNAAQPTPPPAATATDNGAGEGVTIVCADEPDYDEVEHWKTMYDMAEYKAFTAKRAYEKLVVDHAATIIELDAATAENGKLLAVESERDFYKLCEREIVKIRELTLKDDEYTGDLLGDAVGSPVGVTFCVEARMKQIADLQAENLKLALRNGQLAKQITKLKHTANLDEGFIDFLTTKDDSEVI